jgi:hypothetical protein
VPSQESARSCICVFRHGRKPPLLQSGQRHTSGYFYRTLYNGGNFSFIWQNKTHFYTILTTNLYDKSHTKVPYGLVRYYLHPWYSKSCNFSTIWQNKTHFYTILKTTLYDKSQTKVPYGIVRYYLHYSVKFIIHPRITMSNTPAKWNVSLHVELSMDSLWWVFVSLL